MANTNGERDIDRAQELRRRVKDVQDPNAKKALGDAAKRLERRGVSKLGRIGRRGSPVRRREGGKGNLPGSIR